MEANAENLKQLYPAGKTLEEKKTLREHFIYTDCTIDVNVFNNLLKTLATSTCEAHPEDENSEFR